MIPPLRTAKQAAAMAPSPEIRVHNRSGEARQAFLNRAAEVMANHPEVVFSYAHGSFLQAGPYRDMDLVVYLTEPLPPSRFRYEDALELELSQALALDFPVDVRIANGTPLPFQHHAYQGQLLFDRNPDLRATVLSHIAARYLDIKPILDHHAREAFVHDPRS